MGAQGGRKYSDTGGVGAGEGALRRAHPAQPGWRGAREGYVWKLAEGEGAGDAGHGGGGGAGAEGAGDGGGGGGSAAVGDGVERDGEAGVRGRSWEVEELKSSRVEELKSSRVQEEECARYDFCSHAVPVSAEFLPWSLSAQDRS